MTRSLKKDSDGTFILAALNSAPIEFIFRRLNSNTQVSAGEINALPFPPSPDEARFSEIEGLVSELLDTGGIDSKPESACRAIEIERHLDRLIGGIYGLADTEIEEIGRRLPSYEEVYGIK